MSLPAFTWLSQAPCPPARWDLRHIGWELEPLREDAAPSIFACPALLDWRAGHRFADWRKIRAAPLIVAIGVEDPQVRAELIASGFGDALPAQVALVELAARLLKLDTGAPKIPRQRQAGPVTLDLFHRDGRYDGRWLGLHPREFGLLWRLSETPFSRVSKAELLADVWRLDHVPETNSLEVHVSRLRAKLAVSGVGWLVRTCPEGGYQLGQQGGGSFSAFSCARREKLDSGGRFGKAAPALEQQARDQHGQHFARFDRTG